LGDGSGGHRPLLGEGILGSVRLGRLGIGMISKCAKKDGTTIVHQCRKSKVVDHFKLLKLFYNIEIIFNYVGRKLSADLSSKLLNFKYCLILPD
jgi:hypothetical protein